MYKILRIILLSFLLPTFSSAKPIFSSAKPIVSLGEGNLQIANQTGGSYQFRFIDSTNGLSSNSVMSMFVDSEGYLWIGTEWGLNRYDGYEVTSYSMVGDKYHLSNVIYLEEDAKGKVWIFNSIIYALYDTSNHQFSNDVEGYLRDLGITLEGAFRVKVAKGGLWVVEEGRLHYYDFGNGRLQSWRVSQVDLTNFYTKGMAASDDGLYLSMNSDVWYFNRSTGSISRLELPRRSGSGGDTFEIFIDTDGTLWVYSIINDMVCKYSVGGKVVKEVVSLGQQQASAELHSDNNAIRALADDGNGTVWIATDHEGIYLYDKRTEQVTNLRHSDNDVFSLSSNNVTSLLRDNQGNIWAGHYKTGISYTATSTPLFVRRGQMFGDVSTMASDAEGRLWIGTDGDGLYVEYPDGRYERTSLPRITISSILFDPDGTVWVGSYNKGLYHLFSTTRYEHFSVADGSLLSDNMWRMEDDGLGHIWYASGVSPLSSFDKASHKSRLETDDKGGNIMANALAWGNGRLYVGTYYGLWTINPQTGARHWQLGNRSGTAEFVDAMILNEYYDARRSLLFLTHTNGLTIYDTQSDSIYRLSEQLGRIGVSVRDMRTDAEGNYWMSTSSGISRLTIDERDGRLEFSVQNFTHREGLQTPYFNNHSSAVSHDGRICFGSINGYTSIDPTTLLSVDITRLSPKISDIIVGDELIRPDKDGRIVLDHDAAGVVVKFFSGTLNNSSRIRYAYMLKGAMAEWAMTDENRISLVGLSPGHYTLYIKVSAGDGAEGQLCSLDIVVRPPFYQSWWMICIYLLVVALMAYYLLRRYQQRQNERMEQERLDLERQKQTQLADMKLKFFTNISHDLRTPLTLIISPLESIINRAERGEPTVDTLPMLRNMLKNARLLYSQVTSLLDFRRLDVGVESLQADTADIVSQLSSICMSFHDYALEKGITLSFNSSRDSFLMLYDKKKMEKVVYNLLSNAFKFTPKDGSITLSVNIADGSALIEVADTGCGIADADKANIFTRFYQSRSNDSSQAGSGIGLHIAGEYIAMHGGKLSVRDNTPHGSVFAIELPVRVVEHVAAVSEPTSSGETVTSQEATRPSILIVDDNDDMLQFISSSLSSLYDVRTATNGQEALDVLHSEAISLVVSDVMMPVMDGLELCRRMKSDIAFSHIPVILLTARTTEANQLEGLQLGADDYVMKPFNMDVLTLRIAKFMEWAQMSHRQFREKMEVSPSEITITPLDEQFIQNAIKIVEDHMDDSGFTVESLGQAVCMSRSNLYKKLMAITGQGPAEFIRTLRIKRGKALLEKSQMQVTEIAYKVGFNSLKSFTTNFKAEYGMTPTEYVKSLKKD